MERGGWGHTLHSWTAPPTSNGPLSLVALLIPERKASNTTPASLRAQSPANGNATNSDKHTNGHGSVGAYNTAHTSPTTRRPPGPELSGDGAAQLLDCTPLQQAPPDPPMARAGALPKQPDLGLHSPLDCTHLQWVPLSGSPGCAHNNCNSPHAQCLAYTRDFFNQKKGVHDATARLVRDRR